VPQADLVPPLVKVAMVEAAHGAVPPVGAAHSGGGAAEGLVALEAGGSSGPAPGMVRRTRNEDGDFFMRARLRKLLEMRFTEEVVPTVASPVFTNVDRRTLGDSLRTSNLIQTQTVSP
jgi:hypothetical protein